MKEMSMAELRAHIRKVGVDMVRLLRITNKKLNHVLSRSGGNYGTDVNS